MRRISWAAAVLALVVSASCGGSHSSDQTRTHDNASSGGGGPSAAPSSAPPADDVASADASADAGAGAGAGFVAPTGEQAQQVSQAFSEGSAAYARGDFPNAAQSFRRAYELYPGPAMAFNLARVYERMGDVEQAIHFFEIVQHATPTPSAEQLAEIERRVAALRAYEQRRREGIAQTLPTTDALSQEGNTWFQRGVSLYRRRNYRQALIAFEQAHQYLQTPELFYNLAVTYRALHDVQHALEFMREYLDGRRGTPEEAWIEQQIHALEAQR